MLNPLTAHELQTMHHNMISMYYWYD